MNKTKLEVIRINEDVIATSIAGVGYVGYYDNLYSFKYRLNNSSDMKKIWGSSSDYQGYTNDDVLYDCDANGNIIGKCNHGANAEEKYAAHGIDAN